MKIEAYTDGACSGNPGPGGYAFIMLAKGNNLKCSGYNKYTTNNCMELTAILKAVKHCLATPNTIGKREIKIYSDSAYCLNAINQGWIYNWEQNEWKTNSGETIKNIELWKELYNQLKLAKKQNATIKFVKVKGHSGNKYNELVDNLAKEEIRKRKTDI